MRRPTSVPTSANTNSPTGAMQIGRPSERTNTRGSSVGISAMIQSTTKMATPDVDHGNNVAITTASRSTLRIRATGLCDAAKTNDAFAIQDVFLSAL
jgi:hypothetical protein